MVVRQDLPLSYQGVQGAHAAIDFQHQHPELAKEWQTKSNYLIFLSVKDESSLERLMNKADQRSIIYTPFHEPDIGNELTAVAFEPSDVSKKLLSNLPLMKKEITI